MTYPAIAVRVLIASPGDATQERDRVERTLHQWNASRSAGAGVVLMPIRWETHGVPVLGTDAQDVLNGQIVDSADVVVAFFDSKLGTMTARGVSGTAEEIERAVNAGKPVHVWFSSEPLPRNVDLDQLARLNEFKATMRATGGLIGEYADIEELAFGVRAAVEHDVASIIDAGKAALNSPVHGPTADAEEQRAVRADDTHLTPLPRARLRAQVGRMSGGGRRVTVVNSGTEAAEDLSIQIITENDRELGLIGDQGITLLDGADYSWTAWLSLADSAPRLVRMTWIEDGQVMRLDQPISGL